MFDSQVIEPVRHARVSIASNKQLTKMCMRQAHVPGLHDAFPSILTSMPPIAIDIFVTQKKISIIHFVKNNVYYSLFPLAILALVLQELIKSWIKLKQML